MTIFNVFSMLGGLGLFLFGMNMTSNNLEIAAGDKMKGILERLTSNRIVAVTIGALITALIQSSSAVTVMVVGFVNSGIMKLENAVWIVMGANIGTTITGQMVAFKITDYAPLIIFIGALIYMFNKSQKTEAIGGIILGIGVIFLGMETMSSAMSPLKDVPEFVSLLTKFQNPVIGIAVGALFTAIIQSSAASIGVLQALALSGAITLPSAIYVLFGQNIGTCVTSLIASIGTNRNAKRVTVIHLSFNIIGTVIFVAISLVLPFTEWMQALTPSNVAAQIANTHTIFNVVTTLLLLPFGQMLVKLSYLVLPPVEEEHSDEMSLKYLDLNTINTEYRMGSATIMLTNLFKEVLNMVDVAKENVSLAFGLIKDYNEENFEKIKKNEEYIDFLNEKIVEYCINVASRALPEDGARAMTYFLNIVSNIERIGDHAKNLANRAEYLHRKNRKFSKHAIDEITAMETLCTQVLDEFHTLSTDQLSDIVTNVDVIEDNIDKTNRDFSKKQLERLKENECTIENSVVFTKVLTDYERIGDRCLDIAKNFYDLRKSLVNINMDGE